MVSPTTIKTLARELTALHRSPPADIRVALSGSDILSFSGWIQGPPSTPYSSGYFRITFDFTDIDFPNVPPICRFATPIFHPNVSRSGEICVSSLKKDWSKHYGIERILITIKCLLIEPNADSALDAEASRLMQEDYQSYEETATLWTSIHASKTPACFAAHGETDSTGTTGTPPPPPPPTTTTTAAAAAAPLGDGLSQAQLQRQALASCAASVSGSASKSIATPLQTRPAITSGPKRGLRRL